MTKQELKEWIKSAKYDSIAEDEYDENNNFRTCIYEKDDKLYSIHYCNGEPTEVWGDKGYIRGVYQPVEVTRHTEIIKRVYYKPVKRCDHKFISKDLLCTKCGKYYPEVN